MYACGSTCHHNAAVHIVIMCQVATWRGSRTHLAVLTAYEAELELLPMDVEEAEPVVNSSSPAEEGGEG